MSAILWLILAVVLIGAAYLAMIAPARSHPDATMLEGWYYAHRGLHDGNHDVPENSMAAFTRAVEAGYGMELDVQLTRDGVAVVHHDASLKRVCGVDRNIRDLTLEELRAIPMPDGSCVPLFSEVLEMVDGRTPIIVEIKHYGGAAKNAAEALRVLSDYEGPYCVESFHPLAVRYFRKHAPQIVRGQLAAGGSWNKASNSFFEHIAMKYLLVNALGRPHFVAYSVPQDRNIAMWLMKRVFHPLLAAWTIRDQATFARCRAEYHYPIFELFTPEE